MKGEGFETKFFAIQNNFLKTIMLKKKLKDIVLFFQALLIKIIMPCHVECHGFWRHIRINTISKTARVVIGVRAHLNKVSFLIGDNGSVCIDEGARLQNVTFHLCGTNAKVHIGSYCVINNAEFWIEDNACEIIVGDNTYIGGVHLAATGINKKILIGKDCMFSSGIVVRTGDSHSIINVDNNEKINPEQDVVIDAHVWIAQNVTILKGSHISKDSVVGCGAIVSDSFEQNSLIVGVPAKSIKKGISWSTKRFL